MDTATLDRLALHRVDLRRDQEIEYPGTPIKRLVFIEEGIASMKTTSENGSQAQIALAGSETVLGTSLLIESARSLNRVYMQVAGYGFTVAAEVATSEFKRCELFQDLVLCSIHLQFLQVAQTAGCNARHSAEQRLERRILLYSDKNHGFVLPVSQAFIADVLGSRRSTISIVASRLQTLKLFEYTRGRIEFLIQEAWNRSLVNAIA